MGPECSYARGNLSDDYFLSCGALPGAEKAEVEVDEVFQEIEIDEGGKKAFGFFGLPISLIYVKMMMI